MAHNRSTYHKERRYGIRRPMSGSELAQSAVQQNTGWLKGSFPNIASISDVVVPGTGGTRHRVALYLSDRRVKGLPSFLTAVLPNGEKARIATEIIPGVGKGGIHICQEDGICCSTDNPGSICCLVRTANGTLLAASAGHVYSSGMSTNHGGELADEEQTPALVNSEVAGRWYFQLIDWKSDLALADMGNTAPGRQFVSFAEAGHYTVSDSDIGSTQVRIVSNSWTPRQRDAYILDRNTGWDVAYADATLPKNNIILIGNSPDRRRSRTVSQGGDSGGCVYEPRSGKLVGLILGGNDSYTWVLPLQEIFEEFDYRLI